MERSKSMPSMQYGHLSTTVTLAKKSGEACKNGHICYYKKKKFLTFLSFSHIVTIVDSSVFAVMFGGFCAKLKKICG